MRHALIGHSGFVGSCLTRQHDFQARYRSVDLGDASGQHFDLVICAGAPAQKWIANRDPDADRANIGRLMAALESIRANRFVLVSTVDVFLKPVAVDESTPVIEEELHPYGRHRRELERFVADRFGERAVVARLPGLVGPGLRKNALYDIMHRNNVDAIDSRSVFQFYPMVNLWADLQIPLEAGLPLVHLTAEPVSMAEVAGQGFQRPFRNELAGPPARYDMRTLFAERFGGGGHYQYSARESILAIRCYAQSEPSSNRGA